MPKAACRQCGACIEGMDHHCPFIGELRSWPAFHSAQSTSEILASHWLKLEKATTSWP
jgi:hypothetical protein